MCQKMSVTEVESASVQQPLVSPPVYLYMLFGSAPILHPKLELQRIL